MCLQAVTAQALTYLKIDATLVDDATMALIEQCFGQLQDIATPHFITKIYPLTHAPLMMEDISLDFPELTTLFADCHAVLVIGATLGIAVDRESRRLSRTDMAKLVVFDAVASSYLEAVSDQHERTLDLGVRTFRYCPGYGTVPLELNRVLCRALQMDKHIGLTVQPSMLLLPQKSIIGLIGLGADGVPKSCEGCHNFTDCVFRKKEQRCYRVSPND